MQFLFHISGTLTSVQDLHNNLGLQSQQKMKSRLYFSAIFLVFGYGLGAMAQSVTPPPILEPLEYTCENITQIEFCSEVGYSTASFPNYRDQFSQTSASSELENFRALAQIACSNAVVHFLCLIYAPFCDPNYPNIRVPPCREMCEHVRLGCEPPAVQFGLIWPPHLECSQYPSSTDNDLVYCPDNIAALAIPSNIQTNAPPKSADTIVATTTPTITTVTDSTTIKTTFNGFVSGRFLRGTIPLFSVSASRPLHPVPTAESNHSCKEK